MTEQGTDQVELADMKPVAEPEMVKVKQTVKFSDHVKIVDDDESGLTVKFWNKPFGFTIVDENGRRDGKGAFIDGAEGKGMRTLLPKGYRLQRIGDEVVGECDLVSIAGKLADVQMPVILHFLKKDLFSPDHILVEETFESSKGKGCLIEFKTRPLGFSVVDEGGFEHGYGAKVADWVNPALKKVLPLNSYIVSINGEQVVSSNHKLICRMLRRAEEPVRIRFRKANERFIYCYDYDLLGNEDGEPLKLVKKDFVGQFGPHLREQGISIQFFQHPLGIKIEPDTVDTSHGVTKCKGAKILAFEDGRLGEILDVGARLASLDTGKGQTYKELWEVPTEKIVEMMTNFEKKCVVGFVMEEKEVPVVIDKDQTDNFHTVQFPTRPLGFTITDVNGGESGYGARIHSWDTEHLQKMLPGEMKLCSVNGLNITTLNYEFVQHILYNASMPCQIEFEDDGNPKEEEEAIEVEAEADGVMVEFIRMPFGHIATRDQDERYAKYIKEDKVKDDYFPEDAFEWVDDHPFVGNIFEFNWRPYGLEFTDLKGEDDFKYVGFEGRNLGIDTVLETGYVTVVDSGSQACQNGVERGWVVHTVNDLPYTHKILTDAISAGKPMVVGFRIPGARKKYGATVSKIRNRALSETALEVGACLVHINGEDVRFMDTDAIKEKLSIVTLPVRLSFVDNMSMLHPPPKEDVVIPRTQIVGTFKGAIHDTGFTMKFNRPFENANNELHLKANKRFGFTLVDEHGGPYGEGASVATIEAEDLEPSRRKLMNSRLVAINNEDVKHQTYQTIVQKLRKVDLPCKLSFIFPHQTTIKNYRWEDGQMMQLSSQEVWTYSRKEGFNVQFLKKPYGLKVISENRDNEGPGAIVNGYLADYEKLEETVPKGSRVVSIGRHHVSEMSHMKILDIVKSEPCPVHIGFTYDPFQGSKITDDTAMVIKSAKGCSLVKCNSKPMGFKIKDIDNNESGYGAKVTGYTNKILENIVPKGSRLISINGTMVADMNYKAILKKIWALEPPFFLMFSMHQKRMTPYGRCVIDKIREDGIYEVTLTDLGTADSPVKAYLTSDYIKHYQLTEQEEEEVFEEATLDAPEIAPMLSRGMSAMEVRAFSSTNLALKSLVGRSVQDMEEINEFFDLHYGESQTVATDDQKAVDFMDEFDEFDESIVDKRVATQDRKAYLKPVKGATSTDNSTDSVSIFKQQAAARRIDTEQAINDKEVIGTNRDDWTIGSTVEVFSCSLQRWSRGQITNISTDEEGEWIIVVYDVITRSGNTIKRTKETQRHYDDIRPAGEAINVAAPEISGDLDTNYLSGLVDDESELQRKLKQFEEASDFTSTSLSPKKMEIGI